MQKFFGGKKKPQKEGEGKASEREAKHFRVVRNTFLVISWGGVYYICFPTNPFPKHRRFVCVVLPEGTYERNGAIKHSTFKKVCAPVLNLFQCCGDWSLGTGNKCNWSWLAIYYCEVLLRQIGQ